MSVVRDLVETAAVRGQREAVEQSGWGRSFRPFQPHNLCWWVFVAGLAAGVVAMVTFFTAGGTFYAPAVAGGTLLFAVYLVPWLLLLHHHNRFTSLPTPLLLAAGLWGAFAAPFWIALPANTALLEIWAKLGGTTFATNWAAGLTAPINEEFGKAAGAILLLGLAPKLIRSPYDGFIVGAYIGLGFTVLEDVLYVYNSAVSTFGANQFGTTIQIFAVRGVAGIVSHALFSAIFCAGLLWVVTRVPGERRRVRGVAVMILAMVFHFTWDDAAGLAFGNPLAMFPLMFGLAIVEIAVLSVVLRQAAVGERRWMRAILQPEVDTGTLTPALQDAVSGLWRERRAYRRQVGRRRGGHLIMAGQDLAHAIASGNGMQTPELERARTELRRLSSQPG